MPVAHMTLSNQSVTRAGAELQLFMRCFTCCGLKGFCFLAAGGQEGCSGEEGCLRGCSLAGSILTLKGAVRHLFHTEKLAVCPAYCDGAWLIGLKEPILCRGPQRGTTDSTQAGLVNLRSVR